MVDEEVVEPEDGVGGRGVHVGHDAADAVVAVGVGATLGASGHVLVRRVDGGVVAGVDPVLVGVGGQAGVALALQAVSTSDGGAWADVDGHVGEGLGVLLAGWRCVLSRNTYAIRYASAVDVGEVAKVVAGEDVGLREASGVAGLIEPWQRAVEATLGAEEVLKRPHEVTVPEEELCVSVDVGGELLVKRDQVFVLGLRARVPASRRASLKTTDGAHECGLVAWRVRIPFDADARVCALIGGSSRHERVHLRLGVIVLGGVDEGGTFLDFLEGERTNEGIALEFGDGQRRELRRAWDGGRGCQQAGTAQNCYRKTHLDRRLQDGNGSLATTRSDSGQLIY